MGTLAGRRYRVVHKTEYHYGATMSSGLTVAHLLLRETAMQHVISVEEERMRFLVGLLKESELFEPTEAIAECRDPKDNKFLELAFCGKADCIISGDDDLLALNPFREIPIITPREFLSFRT